MSPEMLECFDCAVIGVDSAMRIRACNAAAEDLLAGAGPLVADRGRLASRVSTDDIVLGRLVVDASATTPGGGLMRLSGERGPLVRVAPLRQLAGAPSLRYVTALLFVGGPEEPGPDSVQALQRVFGFAPAEARVAAGLLHGRSLRAIGAAEGLDERTVRAYAATLLQRTGTHHQGELADRLVMAVGLAAHG